MSFLAAAEHVLAEGGVPMHYRDITGVALDQGLLNTQGKTPEATLNAQISTEIVRRQEHSTFVRTQPGVFGLRRWLDDGTLASEDIAEPAGRSMVPHYPDYARVRDVLPVWDGSPDGAITRMRSRLTELMGTPQDQVDWTDPETWIDQRLEGEAREWARKTWEGSEKRVSPRYVVGHWLLIRNYHLLQDDGLGCLRLTKSGRNFLEEPEGEVVREIDLTQGLLRILRLVAEAGTATSADLLEPWFEFLHDESNVRAESAAKSHLYHRLRNLTQRGLLERTSRAHAITGAGLDYLERASSDQPERSREAELNAQIRGLQEELRQQVRNGFREQLAAMAPYAFEELVQGLLDAMGYQETQTTSRSGDGGVDVLGTIKVGITEIKEVVQVKKTLGNVGRPVLDSLRGALYRFDAVQGTIITTGGFTRDARSIAFDRGAPPIALIDGETLIDLLISHGIGVDKRKIELWSLDPGAFVASGQDGEA